MRRKGISYRDTNLVFPLMAFQYDTDADANIPVEGREIMSMQLLSLFIARKSIVEILRIRPLLWDAFHGSR